MRILLFLIIFLFNAGDAFSVEFAFDKKMYKRWEVWNYDESLRFEVKQDYRTSEEYLRITLKKSVAHDLVDGGKSDTAFKLISPAINVIPDNCYYLKVKKKSTLGMPFNDRNKNSNHIVWYNRYNEEVGKTPINGMGKKSESAAYFVDKGLLVLPGAEKARIVLGCDTPDFSKNDFLDIYEVKFEEYQNKPLNFEQDGDLGWEIKQNYQNQLVMELSDNGADGSRYCYRVKRDRQGKADTAFRLASPYIPVEPDAYHILSFGQRHNYDFTRVTKGYCQILWYDAVRNLIEKTDMGSLMGPHLDWFIWAKPFFRSPKGARLARVEFGNDWPDFKYGDFWEVDDVWLRGH